MNTTSRRCGQRPAVRESVARAIATSPATKPASDSRFQQRLHVPAAWTQTPGRLMLLLHCIRPIASTRPCTASESHPYHFAAVSAPPQSRKGMRSTCDLLRAVRSNLLRATAICCPACTTCICSHWLTDCSCPQPSIATPEVTATKIRKAGPDSQPGPNPPGFKHQQHKSSGAKAWRALSEL